MATPAPGDDSDANFDVHVQKHRPRACQSCARSKIRCVWPAKMGVGPCQRCTKIKTACTLVELKLNRRRRGPSTRVGHLEEKLDGIMSLLNSSQPKKQQQHQTQHSNHISFSKAQKETQSFSNPEEVPEPEHLQTFASIASPRSSVTGITDTPSLDSGHMRPPTFIDIVPGFRMTFEEADGALDLYRSVYTLYFPFVPIPLTMTAIEMYQTTPFLLRTILQVTAPQTPAIQREVHRWFRQYIAEHVVVEQEKRLELLQCILVFVAWGNFQFYIESQATNLLQLAGAIVIDLGLNKSPDSLGANRGSFLPEAIRKVKGQSREGHTLDDKRAMLGWSYLSSVVATLFRRMRSSEYTSYHTRCCETLLAAQYYNSDKLLVALVGIQRILTRVSDAFPTLDLDDTQNHVLDAPLYMIIATAKKELDALVQNQPLEVRSNVLLWTCYHGALMRLYEPAIHMRSSQNSNDLLESTCRTEALWNCLQAAKSFFAAYATTPFDSLGTISLVATAYMSFAVVTSSRILFLDDSDWEVNLARKSFDFAAACQDLGDRFREGDRLAQSLGRRRMFEDNGESVLAAHHMKILWIRRWYLDKTSMMLPEVATAGPASVSANTGPVGSDMNSDPQQQSAQDSSLLPIELDEAFWRTLLDSNPVTYMPEV